MPGSPDWFREFFLDERQHVAYRIVLVERLVDFKHYVDVLLRTFDHKAPLTSGIPDFPTFLTGD